MYRKPGITLVGILLLVAGIVLVGSAIHQMRKSIIDRNNKPITQEPIVSAPTPDFSTPVPTVQPTQIPSIADIGSGVVSNNPLPKTGPAAGMAVVFGLASSAVGATWYAKQRQELRRAAHSITVQ